MARSRIRKVLCPICGQVQTLHGTNREQAHWLTWHIETAHTEEQALELARSWGFRG